MDILIQETMEPNEQGQRNSSTNDFQKSLDELQHLLEEDEAQQQPQEKKPTQPENAPQPKKANKKSTEFDLAEWEDAIADIDEYFKNKNQES